MEELVIYKSDNNGLGGSFLKKDKSNKILYEGSQIYKYCCFYLVNESPSLKKILKISSTSVDYSSIALLNSEVLINQLSPIHTDLNEQPDNLNFESYLIGTNIVLEANDFIAIWLRISKENSSVKSEHSVSLQVEWIDEY